MAYVLEVSGEEIEEQVPVLSLAVNHKVRELEELFAARYKQKPEFFVRVPGRVNIIGEHIDYCGYGVCPMALEQDIMVAVASNSTNELRIANVECQYEDFTCDISNFKIDVSPSAGGPRWYKYFLCGVRGVAENLATEGVKGMNIAVNGNVPQSAGLSSSSALVSAAALATAYRNKLSVTKQTLANISAECEKYIGTQGGGMDQAIAFLASEGCAKLIEFNPLRTKDLQLPPGAVFVIAHSLVRLNKAATADFNCRVIECRLASQLLAKRQGLSWQKIPKLSDLQQILKLDLVSMYQLVEQELHKEPYSKEEICEELNVSPEALNDISLTPNTRDVQSFKLHQRAMHVFQEALRVRNFHAIAEKFQPEIGENERSKSALVALGALMNGSHDSLRDLYECSHPKLDRLVELSKGIAYGMRLTGAGWGGCAVAMLPEEKVDMFIEVLKKEFYVQDDEESNRQVECLVFTTSPKSGACVYIYD